MRSLRCVDCLLKVVLLTTYFEDIPCQIRMAMNGPLIIWMTMENEI